MMLEIIMKDVYFFSREILVSNGLTCEKGLYQGYILEWKLLVITDFVNIILNDEPWFAITTWKKEN